MEPGERTTLLSRMFIVDAVPSVLFEHYLAPAVPILPRELDRLDSLYLYLSRAGLAPLRAEEVITAGALTAAQAERLDTTPGAPALVRTRVAYADDERPIEHTTYWIRADRYELKLHLRSTFT
jgi:GntR family transcriptional regulator